MRGNASVFEYDLTVNQVFFDFAGAQAGDLHKVPKNMRDFVFSELLFPVLIDKEFRSASLRDAYVSAKKKLVLYDFAAYGEGQLRDRAAIR